MGIERVEPNNQSTINQSLIAVVVYSTLQRIARDFLAVQVTSAFSEREFSKAGKVFVPEKNRLGSSAANATLCLKSWYHINCLCNVDGSTVPTVDVE